MATHGGLLRIQTKGHGEIVDITEGVRAILRSSEIQLGVVTVFGTGSTVAVTTMEYEPGGVADLREVLDRLVPVRRDDGTADYEHNRLNRDTNAYAHLRAALIGPSESIPIANGELLLGTWQQIVLLDFDDRPRTRVVSVHVVS